MGENKPLNGFWEDVQSLRNRVQEGRTPVAGPIPINYEEGAKERGSDSAHADVLQMLSKVSSEKDWARICLELSGRTKTLSKLHEILQEAYIRHLLDNRMGENWYRYLEAIEQGYGSPEALTNELDNVSAPQAIWILEPYGLVWFQHYNYTAGFDDHWYLTELGRAFLKAYRDRKTTKAS